MALQTFSPREIQARVRGGETAEVVAAETGWPLDKVLRYAEPLLAERAFIAEQAQAVEVRRSGGGATLLESAYQAVGSDPAAGTIHWDAWRREDGKWIVAAAFTDSDGTHGARWTYDHVGRNLHPLDDIARTLMGARPIPVPDPEVDIAEALDLIADIPVVREDAADARPYLVAVPDADDDEFDDIEVVELDAELDEAEQIGEADETDALFVEPPAPPTHSEPTVTIAHPSVPAPDTAPTTPAAARKAAKPRARKGRASVPSWDEILFGASKPEE